MTNKLKLAQKYLCYFDGFNKRRIVDIEMLSKVHSLDKILSNLKRLYSEKQELVVTYLINHNVSTDLDRSIGGLFRLRQAIRLLEEHLKEGEDDENGFEHRTAVGS